MDNGNIINLTQWKPKQQADADALWDAAATEEERKEIFDKWGLTVEEFGDLTYWGHEFRKGVLLKHLQALRLAASARPHASPFDELGEQLALAVGALLISRVSVQGIGELVETLLRSGKDEVIANMFEGYDEALNRTLKRHPPGGKR